jgi:Na+-transporting methylmalonyl-CoA/oxaloacetate decarboxylase gamma subunit
LVLLVFTIKLMAYLLGKYAPEQQAAPPAKIQSVAATVGNDAAVTAAIGVAVHQFRKNNPKS